MDRLLQEDLALQRKKLEDLMAWGSLPILIEMQTALIADAEKRLPADQVADEKVTE